MEVTTHLPTGLEPFLCSFDMCDCPYHCRRLLWLDPRPAGSVSSKLKYVPSWPVSNRGWCMFSTSMRRYTATRRIRRASRIRLTPVGSGGTDFGPSFRWLEEKGIYPQTMVFLTDLWCMFPNDAPNYPVIWASTDTRPVPFGQVVPMAAA
jgi:hypothetical protein